MFDIQTAKDFLQKLLDDHADFKKQPDSARLALNCALTAYHMHEWVWGDWLKTDYEVWRVLGIKDKKSFLAWIERTHPWFQLVQALADGTKHFTRQLSNSVHRVRGYGQGPYGVGPFGRPYLLLDYGESAGEHRWQTAEQLLDGVVDFWTRFFTAYHPSNRKQSPGTTYTP